MACDIDVSFLFCSEEQSRLAARKYARVVQKLGFPVSSLIQENTALFFIMQKPQFLGEKVCMRIRIGLNSLSGPQGHVVESLTLILCLLQAKFTEFKIQNMVGSCDVRFPIRLEGLVLAHGQFSR